MDLNIPIGALKTNCYKLLQTVQDKNVELLITKRGEPIARILPISDKNKKKSIFGSMQDILEIKGDIVEPIDTQWDAAHGYIKTIAG
jgi:prevent-host-death family protein